MNGKLVVLCAFGLSYLGFCSSPGPDASASHLQVLLKRKDYVGLEQSIHRRLSPDDRTLFSGILANRKNQIEDSTRLLEPLASRLAAKPSSWRERELLATLADDYSKTFHYAKSAQAFSALLQRYGKTLSEQERKNAAQRKDEMQLLRFVARQTVELNQPYVLPATRNPLGLIEIPVEAGGQMESWVLDTGANTSVITESTARRIGLQLLEGSAKTGDYTGIPVSYRVGVAGQLKIGSAVFHNVELCVAADQAFHIGDYQIAGIIGFPVQSALGRITVYADGHVGINTEPATQLGSELFMEGQSPIAVAKVAGTEQLFSLDTGAMGSTFGPRLAAVLKTQLMEKMKTKFDLTGAGGTRSLRGYEIERLSVALGGQEVILPTAGIVTDLTSSSLDVFFGNLGQDIFAAFTSYTFDFQNMTFIARK